MSLDPGQHKEVEEGDNGVILMWGLGGNDQERILEMFAVQKSVLFCF